MILVSGWKKKFQREILSGWTPGSKEGGGMALENVPPSAPWTGETVEQA